MDDLAAPPPVPAAAPPHASAPTRREHQMVLSVVAAWALVLGVVTVVFHDTPLYDVETDLVGEYLPAAQEIASGRLVLSHFSYKGPGYPLLLAAMIRATGDGFLAARLLSLLAAAAASWLAWRLARDRGDARFAGIVLTGMLVNPTLVHHAVESGTDTPALALTIGAVLLALRPGGWRAALAAGALASFATLTRGNLIVLLPGIAMALAFRRAGRVAWASAAAGAALPLVAWWLVSRGGAPADRNYMNVAWELYGHGLNWEQFESSVGTRFHSLGSVLAYDPLRAALHAAANLIVQRARDAKELMPLWLGVLAIPGMALLAWRRAWRLPLVFAVLIALPLAAVFYNPRFALPLLPFELAGMAAALLALERHVPSNVIRGACAALLAASAVVSAADVRTSLAGAPHELRWAAQALRIVATPGDVVMARKPHVATLTGLRFHPLPTGGTAIDLTERARAAGARFVLYSSLERVTRPEYAALADSGFRLPGLLHRFHRTRGTHFAALYEVEPQTTETTAARAALARWLLAASRRPELTPEDALRTAIQLSNMGAFATADTLLAGLERGGARDANVSAMRSNACYALGALDSSYAACERAMRYATPTAMHWQRLGDVRAAQRRFAEAREHYRRAVALQPASLMLWDHLGRLCLAEGDATAAALAFERAVALDPMNVPLRRMAMGAWQSAGDTQRMTRLYDEGLRAGIPARTLMTGESATAR